jgi:hypothetical protein
MLRQPNPLAARSVPVDLPDAKVTIKDLAGDGDHYAALKGRMGGELHVLALQTSAPA